MKRNRVLQVVALPLVAMALAATAPESKLETFEVDPAHSHVSFKIRHLVSKVGGSFHEFSGTITAYPVTVAGASVHFTIKASSIDTENADRDKHLRSSDFFDVERYPEITFTSEKITRRGDGKYTVRGTLTMHGVSREITVPVLFGGIVKDPWGGMRTGFSITMKLDRKDYGISFNKVLDQGGTLLGDEVEISIELEAVKKA